MYRLSNPVRNYAWGSPVHIPRLRGLAVGGEPVAEMWLGSHVGAPSRVDSGQGLDEVIKDSPFDCLGPRVVDSFGARLPFMMKLLAAAEPLSLQVHPSSERARIRFAQQTVEGVALTARERSYQDESHKPELIFALTRFEGMAGFRDVKKSAAILRLLGGQWLDEIADELEQSKTAFQSLRRVVTEMLALSGSDLAEKLESVRQLAAQAKSRLHRPPSRRRPTVVDRASVERESVRVFDQTLSLIDRYPKDPGVLVTLLLNHVVLAPGEAMYIPAGVIHAYTAGFGVEVMASSDNVVRAGLTSKYVDIPELLQVTDFTPTPPPLWQETKLRGVDGVQLSPPVQEFQLVVVTTGERAFTDDQGGPKIVLCLEGAVSLVAMTSRAELAPGDSVFVTDADGPICVQGAGKVALARVPC